jgi:hypothetical protein
VCGIPPGVDDNLWRLLPARQLELLREGSDVLAEVTGRRPVAFRAGNYAAGEATLGLLPRAGIAMDFSYNARYAAPGQWGELRPGNAATQCGDVVELPVTNLCEPALPGRAARTRPLEINALSGLEMCLALTVGQECGLRTASVVWHSFSLVRRRRDRWRRARPDYLVRRRLVRLSGYLARHPQHFAVMTASQCAAMPGWAAWATSGPDCRLHTTLPRMAVRHAEQLASR